MSLRIPLAGFALALFAACSQSPAPAEESADAATRVAPVSQSKPDGAGAREAAAAQGDCDLLAGVDIADAFAGRLSVKRAGSHGARGSGCTYDLAEVDESQLILQAGDRNAFEQRKQSYSSQSAIAMEPLDLGQESWLVNGAQVIAVADTGESVSLGLQMFTFGQPAPVDAAQTREALTALARTALERLQAQSPR